MSNNEVNPEKVQKIIQLAIAILTAIGGFFAGVGAHAATVSNYLSNIKFPF